MSDDQPIWVIRRGDRLFPAAAVDAEALNELPSGKRLRIEPKQARSAPRLRLYWAMIRLIRDNLDTELNATVLHNAIKVRLGYFHIVPFKNGIEKVPKSIAFDNMTEEEFRGFLEDFKRLVREQVIPGINREAFEREALEMLGEEL